MDKLDLNCSPTFCPKCDYIQTEKWTVEYEQFDIVRRTCKNDHLWDEVVGDTTW